MFTGLVHGAAKVIGLSVRSDGGARLTLDHPLIASAKPGDSIAVNGCCLTVVEPQGAQGSFDLLAETLRLTNLGGLTAGSVVNVEPSLKASDRLGGHFVTGHIDACGTVVRFEKVGADWRLDVRAPLPFMRHVVSKGCVSIDGMSLTVAEVTSDVFTIWIIPHTLEVTNLSGRRAGDRVNLESDLLAKYAEKLLGKSAI